MEPAAPEVSADVEQQYEGRIAHAYFVRFHMSLILSAVIASGVLASKGLLVLGVHSLRLRYPIAVLASYLVFLMLVRLWIWYVTLHTAGISIGSLDLGGSGSGGGGSSGSLFEVGGGGDSGGGGGFAGFGGGSSGGGGASSSWDTNVTAASVSQAAVPAPAPAPAGSSGRLSGLIPDIDLGDDGWILILLGLLILAILGAGGYLVFAAPHILPEAACQALLATGLTRISKQEHHNWMRGVLRSTCIPFGIVLVLATVLGWEAHRHCPSATRLVEVFHCAVR